MDEHWNNALSIPAEALSSEKSLHSTLIEHREDLNEQRPELKADGVGYVQRIATGEPFNGLISGRLPMIWAHAQLICNSSDKKKVESGEMVGRLIHGAVGKATVDMKSELLMVTPYLIPGNEGMQLFKDMRKRNVRDRILTSSLESSTVLL